MSTNITVSLAKYTTMENDLTRLTARLAEVERELNAERLRWCESVTASSKQTIEFMQERIVKPLKADLAARDALVVTLREALTNLMVPYNDLLKIVGGNPNKVQRLLAVKRERFEIAQAALAARDALVVKKDEALKLADIALMAYGAEESCEARTAIANAIETPSPSLAGKVLCDGKELAELRKVEIAANQVLEKNGGVIEADQTDDEVDYVMVRRDTFAALETAIYQPYPDAARQPTHAGREGM